MNVRKPKLCMVLSSEKFIYGMTAQFFAMKAATRNPGFSWKRGNRLRRNYKSPPDLFGPLF
jgi:hypothetical protein